MKFAELEIFFPDGTNQVIELDLPLYTIGRGQNNSFRILGDSSISLCHLSLKLIRKEQGNFYRLIDGRLDMRSFSSNGVFLNQKRIQLSADLTHGDEIQIGKACRILYRDTFEGDGQKREGDTMDLEDSA